MTVAVGMPVRMGHAVRFPSPVMLRGRSRSKYSEMLYYNITRVHGSARPFRAQGLPITMTIAAARNGNGTETAQRNQTNRAGMKGISHKITRWNANRAQATT